jgi:DNA replication protein DnaC
VSSEEYRLALCERCRVQLRLRGRCDRGQRLCPACRPVRRRESAVRFATASDMLADLAAQESSAALGRRLRRYTIAQLLCVDEVGYLSYDSRYADLLFEVVTRRYDAQRPSC